MLSFGIDTAPQSFCHSFIALSMIRCWKSAQKSAWDAAGYHQNKRQEACNAHFEITSSGTASGLDLID